MIISATVCPHPPLLFRELSGLVDVAADLRVACHVGLAAALAEGPDLVLGVGGAESSASWGRRLNVDLTSFGVVPVAPVPGPELPLSLRVAARLLAEARWDGRVELTSVGWDDPEDDLVAFGRSLAGRPERIALLVMADGSACRGRTAPGFLDERAFAFDSALVSALGSGDPVALSRADLDLAAELMVSGRSPLRVMAEAVVATGGTPKAQVHYAADPHGVQYVVAHWRL